ncbi:MAG: hypothetical protein FE78DRAFT_139184 [Acidomyces sp. 'richmondensis']|nr:MAG: hypothetical protein FE78DRAFT_139184 [Acidomyces sp. 'richmondensis']
MLSKKPALLIGAYSSCQTLPSLSASSTSSTRRWRESAYTRASQGGYATIAGHEDEHNHAEEQNHGQREIHEWPVPPTGQSCPTPYQIFRMKQNATYTKARFNELVKLYHPDLDNGITLGSISRAVRLERYHLIVAAHTILSDPVKRRAYDRFGAGWEGRPETAGGGSRSTGHRSGPFSRSWNDPFDPIWQNATWEDWERFYARRAREHGFCDPGPSGSQGPTYMPNSYFFVLLVALAMIGSSATYSRAEIASQNFVEQRDLAHDRAAKQLRKVRQEVTGIRDKDDRIEWFLRQRDARAGHLGFAEIEAMREEQASRILPQQDVCRSDDISGGQRQG